ncbi:unnamed protein product, partial [Rotaria magnacalcarata]
MDLASIVLDCIQTFIVNSNSFIYKLDFYSSTILMMLVEEHDHDKNFAQLINCYEKLEEFNLLMNTNNNFYAIIINQVKKKKRTTLVYQSLFSLILNATNKKAHFESIHSIVETLLFQDT